MSISDGFIAIKEVIADMFFYFVEFGDLLYGLLRQFRLHQQCFVEVTSGVNDVRELRRPY